MGELLTKIKRVLRNPREFYKSLKEESIKSTFTYFVFISLFRLVIAFIFLTINQTNIYILSGISYVVGLGISFVAAFILNAWIKLWIKKSEFHKTYQLYVYSDTPGALLDWIPLVGLLARIYGLYILIIGAETIYGIDRKKAILVFVFPAILLIILSFLLAMFSSANLY